jgi:hypothetical protein
MTEDKGKKARKHERQRKDVGLDLPIYQEPFSIMMALNHS